MHARNGSMWQQNRCGVGGGVATNDAEATCPACRAVIDGSAARRAAVWRVMRAYSKVHPSMYQFMVWRLSEANGEALLNAMGHGVPFDANVNTTMLGIPVEFVDSDEIALVLVA